MSASPLPRLKAKKGCTTRLRRGHPWLFSNEIDMTAEAKALPPGSLVEICDAGDQVLGSATFNPHSLIAARMLTREAETPFSRQTLDQRLASALALRSRLFAAPYYRLIHAEADGLPGLIVDRYGDVLAVQPNTAGMDRLLPDILESLKALLAPRALVVRYEARTRALEGLEEAPNVLEGTLEGPVEIEENGVRFYADLTDGQKTGWFFDQRPNRAFIADLSQGQSVLDAYCYAGGFGVLALHRGARSALLVDRSADALALAQKAAERNGCADRLTTQQGEAFQTLERLNGTQQRFGVVIADPPAFVKSKKDLGSGLKGYRKLARLAAGLVEPGGFLLCGSCSHHVDQAAFFAEVTHGLGQAGRSARLLWSHGAGPDHPIHPQLPESAYLKSLVFQVE